MPGPSQAGLEWAQEFWNDEDQVAEQIEQCENQLKINGSH